jgi:hypothetical protein
MIYRVSVAWESTGEMYIHAETKEDAEVMALKLLNNGGGIIDNIDQGGNNSVENVSVVEKPYESEKDSASENKEALNDMEE